MRKSILCAVFFFGFLIFVFTQEQGRAENTAPPLNAEGYGVQSFSRVQPQFPFLARVKKKNVNIRAGQNINFEKIGRLRKWEKIVVLGKSYSWYKIKLPVHADSHISMDFVKMLGNGIGEITGNRVNIRSGAEGHSAVIGQLNKGELVRVLREYPPGDTSANGGAAGSSGGWYRIEPPDQSYGWVLSKYLAVTSKNIPAPRVISHPGNEVENKRARVIKRMKQRALKRVMDRAREKARENAKREK